MRVFPFIKNNSKYALFIDVAGLIYYILVLGALFISGNIFFEFLISFLPLVLFFNIIVISSVIFKNIRLFIKNNLNLFYIFLVFPITVIIVFRLVGGVKAEQNILGNNQIKVGSFNKLYSNDNYRLISLGIEKVDCDIFGIVEIGNNEFNKIDYLSNYQYSYQEETKPWPKFNMMAIYSKYPIVNKESVDVGDNNFISTEIDISGEIFNIILVHTPAPVTIKSLKKRNLYIEKVSEYIENLNSNNVILMGDFNMAPWSRTYIDNFSKGKIKAAESYSNFTTTWDSNLLLSAPIDHIFISQDYSVKQFVLDEKYGSDHHFIWAVINY